MINLVQAAQKSALDLQSVMEYRLTEVPLSLFHLNGTMKKAQKSKLLDCFSFNVPHEVGNHVYIIDMGLLWRIVKHMMGHILHGRTMQKKCF